MNDMNKITPSKAGQLNNLRREIMRGVARSVYVHIFGKDLPLKDVQKDCIKGRQLCDRCDDLICCDNLWMSDLEQCVARSGVSSLEAQFLYILQEMGVRVGPHDARVMLTDMVATTNKRF